MNNNKNSNEKTVQYQLCKLGKKESKKSRTCLTPHLYTNCKGRLFF